MKQDPVLKITKNEKFLKMESFQKFPKMEIFQKIGSFQKWKIFKMGSHFENFLFLEIYVFGKISKWDPIF